MEKEETLQPKQGSTEQKEKRVMVIEELERGDGEVDFSKLSDGDKFQLLTRYLNDICSITKSMLQIVADGYVLIEFMCKQMGIDVKAEKQKLTQKLKAQMEENIQKSKKQLENASKSN